MDLPAERRRQRQAPGIAPSVRLPCQRKTVTVGARLDGGAEMISQAHIEAALPRDLVGDIDTPRRAVERHAAFVDRLARFLFGIAVMPRAPACDRPAVETVDRQRRGIR